MSKKKGLVLIPSRYQSQRFPGKPLAQISGKSMIQRVYENCRELSEDDFDVVIVTDNDEIENESKRIEAKVVRIDDDVVSGSERIMLAYERYFNKNDYEFIINVQGDEPLLKASLLNKLVDFHQTKDFDIATIVKREEGEKKEDPNKVKAVYSELNGECHYFSRSPIPYGNNEWFLHIGVYCYRVEALKKFNELSPSKLEEIERLEQLRAIENEMRIGAIETNEVLIGVDMPEDIKVIEGVLSE